MPLASQCRGIPCKKSINHIANANPEIMIHSQEYFSNDAICGYVEVTLHKSKNACLGITVAGGIDRGHPPRITAIRPGSVADKSDCVLINDVVKSINGIDTADLTHDQIVKITRNAETTVRMALEYILVETPKSTTSKHAFIHLEPMNESFGITVRGGVLPTFTTPFPLTIRRIRSQSCADL
uniref:PDZ domain-containing protein n=1 Tax=Mesocestoides corti TaxID=53468 RepID=A0A5K3FU19_MESCO